MAIDMQSESAASAASASMHRRPPAARSGGWRISTWWIRSILAVATIAAIGTAAAFMSGAVSPSVSLPKLRHTLARRDVEVTVTGQGTLESSDNTEVRCKVKGASSTIVWIIDNGTEVKADDVLVRIDTSAIEDKINTQEIAYQNALATHAQSESDLAVAQINVTEYVEGTYRSELKTKEKDVAIAKANLRSAQNMLNHAKEIYRKGFISKLELEGDEYSLQQAELELEVKETDVDVLTRYTRAKKIQDLEGILAAKKAKLASDKAALDLEKLKLDREKQQLENCIIRAERGGMVTYAKGEEWEDRPDIREGATVREDQVLLLIPDLNKMQVKVDIHEARIDQVRIGMRAQVDLQGSTYDGEVLSIAPMAQRPGWWNGNMVKYETIIKLATQVNLKPGMSADVKIFLAQHKDVLTVPVAAVMQQEERYFCWVITDSLMQRREVQLGDSDDQFLVVKAGVKEGDQVVLNPLAYVDEAQSAALQPFSGVKSRDNAEELSESEQRSDDVKPDETKQ